MTMTINYTHAIPGCDVTGDRFSISTEEVCWVFGLKREASEEGAEDPLAAATAATIAAFFTPSLARLSDGDRKN